jgi:hypothetical protein
MGDHSKVKPDDILFDDPRLCVEDVVATVITTGKDHKQDLLSDIEEDLEYAREDMAAAGSDEDRADYQSKIKELEQRRAELAELGVLVQVRVIFVVPNPVYEGYQADPDMQYSLSSAFFKLLDELVGPELVKHHLFDIKILPKDTDQFWRNPRPTHAGAATAAPQPAAQLEPQPLTALVDLFQAATKN